MYQSHCYTSAMIGLHDGDGGCIGRDVVVPVEPVVVVKVHEDGYGMMLDHTITITPVVWL